MISMQRLGGIGVCSMEGFAYLGVVWSRIGIHLAVMMDECDTTVSRRSRTYDCLVSCFLCLNYATSDGQCIDVQSVLDSGLARFGLHGIGSVRYWLSPR